MVRIWISCGLEKLEKECYEESHDSDVFISSEYEDFESWVQRNEFQSLFL